MNPIKLMLVTDVPYWEKATGAQSRISGLIEGLNQEPFRFQVLVTGMDPLREKGFQVSNWDYPVQWVDLSQPPLQGTWNRIKWYTRAVFNWLGGTLNGALENEVKSIGNWYSRSQIERIREMILASDPDVLVMEYLTQTSVVRSLPARYREKTLVVLDSHDILWKRCEQFKEHSRDHWVEISKAEEEKSYREFDLVIAIQSLEADYIGCVVGEDNVVTTGMEFETLGGPRETGASGINVGFIASANPANVDAIFQMVNHWPVLLQANSTLRLLIAGSICDSAEVIRATRGLAGVELLGRVDSVSDFYAGVDVVWNPVQFGTGLKIKNLEALAHGKALMTSSHGAEGMFEGGDPDFEQPASQPLWVVDTVAELESLFKTLTPEIIQAKSIQGHDFLVKHFGKGTQYPQLRRKIASLFSAKSS
ncbi:MAG: glycosyltransferase [Planctomycetota bacterium]|nr:glycosyltransferase [Planctomycetota bacterium]